MKFTKEELEQMLENNRDFKMNEPTVFSALLLEREVLIKQLLDLYEEQIKEYSYYDRG